MWGIFDNWPVASKQNSTKCYILDKAEKQTISLYAMETS